jgi:hypothetical protein
MCKDILDKQLLVETSVSVTEKDTMKFKKNLEKNETRYSIPVGTILQPKIGVSKVKVPGVYMGFSVEQGVVGHFRQSTRGKQGIRRIGEKALENYDVLDFVKRGCRKPKRTLQYAHSNSVIYSVTPSVPDTKNTSSVLEQLDRVFDILCSLEEKVTNAK